MRFLISAAGTGGHVFPALEFSAECIKSNHEVTWMGTKTGLESRKVPEKNRRAARTKVAWTPPAWLRKPQIFAAALFRVGVRSNAR